MTLLRTSMEMKKDGRGGDAWVTDWLVQGGTGPSSTHPWSQTLESIDMCVEEFGEAFMMSN